MQRTPYYVTFTINAIQKSERKNRDICSYLYAWEIRPGIHSQVLDPSAEELNYHKGKRTATPHMGVHEDRRFQERAPTREVSPIQNGMMFI